MSHGRALRLGFEDWAALETWDLSKPMNVVRTFHSPSESDSSRSYSSNGSSSLSCKSDDSSFSNGELPACSEVRAVSQSCQLNSDSLLLGSNLQLEATVSVAKESIVDAIQHRNSDEFICIQENSHQKQLKRLDMKFLDARLVDSEGMGMNATGMTLGQYREISSRDLGSIDMHHATEVRETGTEKLSSPSDTNFLNEELVNGLIDSSIYGVTECPSKSYSDISQSSGSKQELSSALERAYLESSNVAGGESFTGDWKESLSFQLHTAVPTGQSAVNVVSNASRLCGNYLGIESTVHESKIATDYMSPEHETGPRRNFLTRKTKDALPELDVLTSCDGRKESQSHPVANVDNLALPLKSSPRAKFSASKVPEFLQSSPQFRTDERKNAVFLSPPCQRTGNNWFVLPSTERAKGPCVDKLSIHTFKRKGATPAASNTQVKWRTKTRSAKANTGLDIRSIKAALMGSAINSLPERAGSGVGGKLNGDKLSLGERAFIGPVTSWDMSNALEQSACSSTMWQRKVSYGHFLQASRIARRNLNLKRGAKLVISAKRYLSLGSNSSLHHVPGHLVARSPSQHKSCKPFLPFPRFIRNLPAPKSVLSSRKYPRPSEKVSSALKHSSMSDFPSNTLHGRLQCICQDGFPIYTLLLDNCEQLLIARVHKSETCTANKSYSWVYTFHSQTTKGKAKGKRQWRTWGKKDELAPSLAGNMKVSSVLCPEVTSLGEIKHSIMFEFVLFDGKTASPTENQSFKTCPSDTCPHPPPFLSHTKPLLGKTEGMIQFMPAFAFTPLSTLKQHACERSVNESLQECYQEYPNSPVEACSGHLLSFAHDADDKLLVTDLEVESTTSCPSRMELAAVVIRMPAEEQKLASFKETGGWGLNFLKKSLEFSSKMETGFNAGVDQAANGDSGSVGRVKPTLSNTLNYLKKLRRTLVSRPFIGSNQLFSKEETGKILFSGSKMLLERHYNDSACSISIDEMEIAGRGQDGLIQGQANVTVILPAGLHGIPLVASGRPSPLIERWRSGGKCDCGGWDLGCGLTIISTERPSLYDEDGAQESSKHNSVGSLAINNPLKVYSKGKEQDLVMLSLAVVQEGVFSLRFQTHMAPLVAFAIAVAILHSKEPLLCESAWANAGEPSMRFPHAPSKQPANLHTNSQVEHFFKLPEELASQCQTESSLSPFERV